MMLCWSPEEDRAGVRRGACLGMPHNIHLRGRYLLKFQLPREMAEAEPGLAFAVQRGAVFYLGVMFLTCPKVKKQ